jgi:hypothetical protein
MNIYRGAAMLQNNFLGTVRLKMSSVQTLLGRYYIMIALLLFIFNCAQAQGIVEW